MQHNPNPTHNSGENEDQPVEKTNEDYNKKPPLPNDPDIKILEPEVKVPDIEADKVPLPKDEYGEESNFWTKKNKSDNTPTYLDIINE